MAILGILKSEAPDFKENAKLLDLNDFLWRQVQITFYSVL